MYNMTTLNFSSILAPQFLQMMNERKLYGYKNNYHYFQLDRFLVEQKLKRMALPQKIVELWSKRRETEAPGTYELRITAVRLFAQFLIRQNIPAYYFPKFFTPRIHRNFVPYIYSHEEISLLIRSADELQNTGAWHLHYFPVVIRLLYSTGLRSGEANGLLWQDIDFENGIIKVRQGKCRKDRLVPLSSQMLKHLKKYAQGQVYQPDRFVFINPRGYRCHLNIFGNSFRIVRDHAGIPRNKHKIGPRLHDLRHTFAVHNLEKWLKAKENLQVKLPILANYLGHDSLSGTQQYLRLTPSIFSEITLRMENSIGKMIRSYKNETD
jgi:integrase